MSRQAARHPGLLWHDAAHGPAWNMAADEAMLQRWAGAGRCGLRLYQWTHPAHSIGYFQPHAGLVDATRPWVRRPTGGGRVPHGADLTVGLVVPKGHPLLAAERFDSYRIVNTALAHALRAVGLRDLHLHPHDIPKDADRAALVCFATPAKHDVIGPHGKLVGGAQRRSAAGLLHQGSIQLQAHPALLADPAALAAAVATALADCLAVDWTAADPAADDPDFRVAVDALIATKYATPAWNHKR